jgi:hypothetical protein
VLVPAVLSVVLGFQVGALILARSGTGDAGGSTLGPAAR